MNRYLKLSFKWLLISVIVLIVTGLAVFIWIRVHPPSLGFLDSRIREALRPLEPRYQVSYDDIRLAWPKGRLTPGIDITEARCLINGDTLLARFPSITLRLSLGQLLRGKVEPTEIWLARPRLNLSHLTHPGRYPTTSARNTLGSINNPEFFDDLFAFADLHTDFKRLHAADGRIILPSDANPIEVELPSVVLSMLHVQAGPELILTAAYKFNGQASRVQAVIHAPPEKGSDPGKVSESRINFTNLHPPMLADLAPDLAPLKGLDFTADLEMLFRVAASGTVDNLRFGIESNGKGTLFHPDIWEAPIPLEKLTAKGWLKNAFTQLKLASLHLESGETAFDATGTIDNLGKFDTLSLDVRIDHLNPALAHQYWPHQVIPDTRDWIRNHFLDGDIHDAVAKIRITPADLAAPVLPRGIIDVTAPFSGVAMKYNEDLQPIKDAEGTALFTGHDITINVTGARNYNTRATEGKVAIGNFTEAVSTIDIHANAKGPADDLRKVIDSLTGNTDYPVKVAAGKAETRLSFQWPLSHFSEETFDYHAASKIQGMEIPDFQGYRWAQKTLSVSLDRKAIAVAGTGGEISSENDLETAIPIKKLEARGELSYAPAGVDVSAFSADLDGPALTFSGRITAAEPFPRVLFDGAVDNLPFKSVHQYWPRRLASPLREWIRAHVSQGRISHAGIRIDLDPAVSSLKKLPKTAVAVDAKFSGVQLDYLPPLQPLKEGTGSITLSADAARIQLDSGQVGQSRIMAANSDITDIPTDSATLDIFAEIQGPASDLVEATETMLKDTPEAQDLPALKEAQASTRIQVRYPLAGETAAVKTDYTIASNITRIAINDFHGFNLKNGDAAATLSNGKFLLDGKIWSGETPVSVHWEQSTGGNKTIRLSSALKPENHADFRLPPLPFLKGKVQTDLDLTQTADGTEMESRLDFTEADINLERWGWVKPTGAKAVLQSREKMTDGKEMTVSELVFSGKDLDIKGTGKISLEGPPAFDFQFDPLNAGEHRLSAQLALDPEKGYRVDLKGRRLNAGNLFATKKTPPETSDQKTAAETDQAPEEKPRPNSILTIDIEEALLAGGVKLNHPKGNIVMAGEKIRSAVIDGLFEKNALLHISITEEKEPERLLIRTEDAGAFLKGIDLYRNIKGGTLVFDGRCRDLLPTRQLVSGKVDIRDFLLVDAPGLVKVLSMASLVGALGQLGSGGISFNVLEGGVAFENDVMTLKKGRMEGISLGMTAEGTYDIKNQVWDLKGIVIPVNILNQMVDMIPIFGKLIVGDGIIATDYSIKGPRNDPEVHIRPLTTLSVGFLRNLFRGFNVNPAEGNDNMKETPPAALPGSPHK